MHWNGKVDISQLAKLEHVANMSNCDVPRQTEHWCAFAKVSMPKQKHWPTIWWMWNGLCRVVCCACIVRLLITACLRKCPQQYVLRLMPRERYGCRNILSSTSIIGRRRTLSLALSKRKYQTSCFLSQILNAQYAMR